MAKIADTYFGADPWKIVENGFDPAYSRVSESIFSLANETMGVRGCFDEGGSVDSLRGFYANGVYDIEHLKRSYRGIVEKSHFMIPAADWLEISFFWEGVTLNLGECRFRDFHRELDMRTGTLQRSFVWQHPSGKELKLSFLRFLDMTHRERAYQRITLEPLNFTGDITFTTGLSFNVFHEGRKDCFWTGAKTKSGKNRLMLSSRTTESEQEVFVGALTDLPAGATLLEKEKSIGFGTLLHLEKGTPVTLDKRVVVLFDESRDKELWKKGEALLDETGKVTLDKALAAQRSYWADYWKVADITIESEDADTVSEQQGIRFCIFQLAQTYNGGSMRHNIGAKGLTGEAYNGHAFWDTEACCLPFYLFNDPHAAKDLLLFRYNTLPMALERAKMLDCKGACYPIATLNGEEACALWQHASLQLQPSTAVAYGIWHYVKLTEDRDFLFNYGAEMLLQIARFLKSRTALGNKSGKYGFYGVMGPDEFHMMVNNNAYTNYMGKRSLSYAFEVMEELKTADPAIYCELCHRTGYTEAEGLEWKDTADNMYIPEGPDGLIEQHDGFFDLPHTDIDTIPVTEFPLYDHWSYDRIYRTDMIKQPDVLMILYLYNSSFSEELKRVNYDFYEPRTIHESSLSPAIHSVLAAELGKAEEAVKFFGYATRLDLDNYNRNTREGLHITSIAMAWANIVYGFAGLRSDGDTLSFAPLLPDRWSALNFSLTYRGRILRVRMERNLTLFCVEEGEPLSLFVYGKPCTVGSDGLKVPAKTA